MAVEWKPSPISPALPTPLLIILAYLPVENYGSRVERVGDNCGRSRSSAINSAGERCAAASKHYARPHLCCS